VKFQNAKFYLLTALTVAAVCLLGLSIWAFFQSFNYAFDGSSSLSHNFGEFEPPSTKDLIRHAMWLKMANLILDKSWFAVLLPTLLSVPVAKTWVHNSTAAHSWF
jgi:hypothetical protein